MGKESLTSDQDSLFASFAISFINEPVCCCLNVVFVEFKGSGAFVKVEVAIEALIKLLNELSVVDFVTFDEIETFGISDIKFIEDVFTKLECLLSFNF